MVALSLVQRCSSLSFTSQVSSKLLTAPGLQNCKNFARNKSIRQLFTLQKTLHFRPQYKKDGVSKCYNLIYKNSQGPLLVISRVLSTVGGSLGVALTLWYLSSRWEALQQWEVCVLGGACIFCVATVVSVNVIARFYLMRIYVNESEGRFIGIHQSFFGRLNQIKYSIEDVKPCVRVNGKANHSKSTVWVKNKSFHLQAADFVLPKYYNAHLKLL
ncbi:hypothetical protein PoB_004400400 [Plakobranchus ocellatus]|uniref:Transmembrane protein 186 n=1 Tax=Plakobranchus ocellatus TaxID=259542 RepID=A0AAV4BF97_9GAST|nr:hypothetical protein PoB_004400400 [Plakobranchus ocellatus]